MTTYHIIASLYYKAIYSTQATTIYNGVVTRITGVGNCFSDYRNFNTSSKTVLGDGVTHIVFSARFNSSVTRDQARDAITALTSRLELTYPSYISVHKCHHDEMMDIVCTEGDTLGYGTWAEMVPP